MAQKHIDQSYFKSNVVNKIRVHKLVQKKYPRDLPFERLFSAYEPHRVLSCQLQINSENIVTLYSLNVIKIHSIQLYVFNIKLYSCMCTPRLPIKSETYCFTNFSRI